MVGDEDLVENSGDNRRQEISRLAPLRASPVALLHPYDLEDEVLLLDLTTDSGVVCIGG
jgi:hypothetical protein